MSDWHDFLIPSKGPGRPRPDFFLSDKYFMSLLTIFHALIQFLGMHDHSSEVVYCFFLYAKAAIIQLKPALGCRLFF